MKFSKKISMSILILFLFQILFSNTYVNGSPKKFTHEDGVKLFNSQKDNSKNKNRKNQIDNSERASGKKIKIPQINTKQQNELLKNQLKFSKQLEPNFSEKSNLTKNNPKKYSKELLNFEDSISSSANTKGNISKEDFKITEKDVVKSEDTTVQSNIDNSSTILDPIDIVDSVYNATAEVDYNDNIDSASVSLTNPTNNYVSYLINSSSYDLSDASNISFNFKASDINSIVCIGILLKNNTGSSFPIYISSSEITSNQWSKVTKPLTEFSTDTAQLASITQIQFLVFISSSISENFSFKIDNISKGTIESTLGKSSILFNFEDGYYDTITDAYPLFAKYGLNATVWPIKNLADSGELDFLDYYSLDSLYRAGWDIGNHSETHQDLSTLTTEQQQAEFDNAKNWLISNGWTRATNVATYPNGFVNDSLKEALTKANIGFARGSTYGLQSVPAEDKLNLKTIYIGKDSVLDNIKKEIDNAISCGSTIMLTFHKVKDTPTLDFEISKSLLEDILVYTKSKSTEGKIKVSTISEWMCFHDNIPYTPVTYQDPQTLPLAPDYTTTLNYTNHNTSLSKSEGTLIDGFDDINNWKNTRRTKVTLDTTNKLGSTASLKLQSQVINGGGNFLIESTTPVKNLSSMNNIQFGIYTDNPNNIKYICITLYCENTYHSTYFASYVGAYELQAGWNKIIRTPDSFQKYGDSASLSNISNIRITVYSQPSALPTVNIDDFRMDLTGKSRVLFTFDDGWSDNEPNAHTYMKSKKFEGTIWACKDFATSNDPDFLTTKQLDEFYKDGWDIGNHTVIHPDNITILNASEKKAQYLDNQNWLIQNGWIRGAKHACYPMGSYDEELISILKSIGVQSARTTVYGIQPVDVENVYKIKTIPVGHLVGMPLIKSEIDKAVNSGSTIMFMFHRIQDTPVEVYDISTSDFNSLVDYVYSKTLEGKTEVTTISKWYNQYKNEK